MASNKRNAVAGITLLAGACACAGAPPASLKDARAAYQRASAGPAEELAPAQLHAAQTYLTLAEKTYDDEGDSPNTRDRAYVAMRKSELAEVQARISQASARAAKAAERGDLAAQKEHTATTQALTQTRAELALQKGVIATQSTQLEAEVDRRKQAEEAQQQALASLENVKQEARGTVITLSGSVIFPSGGSDLLPSARNRLSEVATALSQGEGKSAIVVEGHTDSRGSPEMNQELSVRRATAVRDSLVAQGVAANRVSVMGYGSSRPIADNTSETGRANNRRVEIVIQPQAKEPQAKEPQTPQAKEAQAQ
jgi:outer membrane protein OmpA-like peptidoglycan-associated protein